MKFLFIVQGEGRGHLTQAITLEEMLLRNGHEVVEVLLARVHHVRCPDSSTGTFMHRSNALSVRIFSLQQITNGLI